MCAFVCLCECEGTPQRLSEEAVERAERLPSHSCHTNWTHTYTQNHKQATFMYRQARTTTHTHKSGKGTHSKEQIQASTVTCHMQVTYSNRHTHTDKCDSLLIHTCELSTCNHFTLVHRCARMNTHTNTHTHSALGCCLRLSKTLDWRRLKKATEIHSVNRSNGQMTRYHRNHRPIIYNTNITWSY